MCCHSDRGAALPTRGVSTGVVREGRDTPPSGQCHLQAACGIPSRRRHRAAFLDRVGFRGGDGTQTCVCVAQLPAFAADSSLPTAFRSPSPGPKSPGSGRRREPRPPRWVALALASELGRGMSGASQLAPTPDGSTSSRQRFRPSPSPSPRIRFPALCLQGLAGQRTRCGCGSQDARSVDVPGLRPAREAASRLPAAAGRASRRQLATFRRPRGASVREGQTRPGLAPTCAGRGLDAAAARTPCFWNHFRSVALTLERPFQVVLYFSSQKVIDRGQVTLKSGKRPRKSPGRSQGTAALL